MGCGDFGLVVVRVVVNVVVVRVVVVRVGFEFGDGAYGCCACGGEFGGWW